MAIVGGNYGFGDLTNASNQIASVLNNLDADATSQMTNMIKNANTAWDTNKGSEETTAMRDMLDRWLNNFIYTLNSLKQKFDSIAAPLAEQEHFSFSAGPNVEHSGHIQGGDIRNASDVNGSYNPDRVSQALTNGTNSVTSSFDTAAGKISGLDLGLHGELKEIANQMVETVNKCNKEINSTLSEWNNQEVMKQDKTGEAYGNFISSCISKLGPEYRMNVSL